ncbi:hypothetical protein ACLOJK_003810 [Asimina triloba]
MYGTIPTGPGTTLDFISGTKQRVKLALAARRPWNEMAHRHAFGFPSSFGKAILRICTNLGYFRMNYAIIVLLIELHHRNREDQCSIPKIGREKTRGIHKRTSLGLGPSLEKSRG